MNFGPRQIIRQRNDRENQQAHNEANAYLVQLLRRDYPDHLDHGHIMHRGITYEFYSHRSVVNAPNNSYDLSARIIRDDLFERDDDAQDQLFQFHLRDGSLAVKLQVFNLTEPVGLQDLPPATRLYRRFYYYRSDQPIHATVTVVTQAPMQILGINNAPFIRIHILIHTDSKITRNQETFRILV